MSRLPVSGRSPNPPLSSLSKAGRRCPAFCFSLLFSLAPILSCNPSHTPSQSQTSVQAPANRLSDESSPYLRQHAHNPVDWYPWGPAALAVAREQNKPIFLSIGYSSCYWYHVMEREVFENPELAARMNAGFVNIKVDREERPDLDAIYMTATQILSGQGGWPNSIFLTPELAPFFAGTYFPPVDRHGRPGFWTQSRRHGESDRLRFESRPKRSQPESRESTIPNQRRPISTPSFWRTPPRNCTFGTTSTTEGSAVPQVSAGRLARSPLSPLRSPR